MALRDYNSRTCECRRGKVLMSVGGSSPDKMQLTSVQLNFMKFDHRNKLKKLFSIVFIPGLNLVSYFFKQTHLFSKLLLAPEVQSRPLEDVILPLEITVSEQGVAIYQTAQLPGLNTSHADTFVCFSLFVEQLTAVLLTGWSRISYTDDR